MKQKLVQSPPNAVSTQWYSNSPTQTHLNLPVSALNVCSLPRFTHHQPSSSKSANTIAFKVSKKLREKIADEQSSLSPQTASSGAHIANSECRLLLLGTEKSGKSSLMNLIFKPLFQQTKSQLIRSKEIVLSNSNLFSVYNESEVQNHPEQCFTRKVKLSIQEKTGSLNPIHCNEVSNSFDGIVIIYDHTNKKSLQQVQRWLERHNQSLNIPILILGNKLPSKSYSGGTITEQVLKQFEMTVHQRVHIYDFKINAQ